MKPPRNLCRHCFCALCYRETIYHDIQQGKAMPSLAHFQPSHEASQFDPSLEANEKDWIMPRLLADDEESQKSAGSHSPRAQLPSMQHHIVGPGVQSLHSTHVTARIICERRAGYGDSVVSKSPIFNNNSPLGRIVSQGAKR